MVSGEVTVSGGAEVALIADWVVDLGGVAGTIVDSEGVDSAAVGAVPPANGGVGGGSVMVVLVEFSS